MSLGFFSTGRTGGEIWSTGGVGTSVPDVPSGSHFPFGNLRRRNTDPDGDLNSYSNGDRYRIGYMYAEWNTRDVVRSDG